ncbi:RNA methyltransferase [Flavobacteriaceae bacterium]|jgi:23S rRNA (guanosine2251-2'-O)-methyltransferase|nr:RNA methyltransferase [bacterium]MDA9284672.1 RNA methyltransferase [Flavobacteriaceae bacterium]MDA9631787.1 RNA methyltransferase [Bacteroidota bacterium]MDB4196354.1 RNA methyltransferase [Flavobacteriaceae bacterium]|tara:strand:- start:449 stop:970 length:522 start_codon:yes stop_codon:yes gene_type:complete
MRKLKNSELNRISPKEFKEAKKSPVIVILDNIRSLNNIGSIFRTSDAFMVEKIYLCGITATPPHKDINKTALGSTESVEWHHTTSTLELVNQLQKEGISVISIEQCEGSSKLHEYKFEKGKKYAFIFGNEIKGVDQEVINQSDDVIEIPQLGTKHSLNISVSVGIVLWNSVFK